MIAGLGARTDHVALAPLVDPDRMSLTVEERAVLGRIGRVATIGEVVARSGMPEPKAISVLMSLRMKGAIVPARVNRTQSSDAIDAALLEEVELDPARKREILDLDRNLDRLNHFEVLAIAPGVSSAEVKKAYHEASKRFHPDRFFNKNLGSYRGRIERIFKRVTEANQVLGDEAKRTAYLKAHPELQLVAAVSAPRDPAEEAIAHARDNERKARLARHPYLMKGARTSDLFTSAKAAIDKGEFRTAIGQLEQVLQLDEKNAQAKQLLEQARKNENQIRAQNELVNAKLAMTHSDTAKALEHLKSAARLDPDSPAAAAQVATVMLRLGVDAKEAKTFIQRACELDPKNAQYRFVFAQVHLELGMKSLAKRYFEEALKLDPDHADAKAQLKKLRWTF